MSNPLAFRPNTPIGRRTLFTMHGTHEDDRFSPEAYAAGDEIRALRSSLVVGLREGSRAIGMSAVDLSNLELGRAGFVDHQAALAHLRKVWPEMKGRAS